MDKESMYIKRILKVLLYIEDYLEEEITLKDLARIACYSPFHFHRIFQTIMGETVHKYLKRLRMEKASAKIRYSKESITEIGLDAHYETPSAFTKAFKQCIGISPRNYRALYKEVNAMTKKIHQLADITPDKITEIEEIPVLFAREYGDYILSSQKAWDRMMTFIKQEHLSPIKLRYFSISHDNPEITSEDRLRFDACIYTPEAVQETPTIHRQILKRGRYAVFTHRGPHSNLEETFDRIFLKWLVDSKENFDDKRPFFCEHFHLEYIDKDESKLLTHIYIPVLK